MVLSEVVHSMWHSYALVRGMWYQCDLDRNPSIGDVRHESDATLISPQNEIPESWVPIEVEPQAHQVILGELVLGF